MIQPRYQSDRVTLFHGDSASVLDGLNACNLDVLITDPPYGVSLGQVNNGRAREQNQTPYTMFDDTPEYITTTVIPIINRSLQLVKRGVITPGNRNAFRYPEPADIGVWYNPAGTGFGRWGYILAQLIFYYGRDPNIGTSLSASSISGHSDRVTSIKNVLHPCPKPLKFCRWMVGKASLVGETVFDPFMGSGTVGMAAVQLGRKFVGIEIEERYYQLAERRIREAESQLLLGI